MRLSTATGMTAIKVVSSCLSRVAQEPGERWPWPMSALGMRAEVMPFVGSAFHDCATYPSLQHCHVVGAMVLVKSAVPRSHWLVPPMKADIENHVASSWRTGL